jgi:TrmH family RNA methyltransferase
MDVRRAATAKGRATVGAFVVEGRRMLERGLRAGWAPRAVLMSRTIAEAGGEVRALVQLGEERGASCHVLPDDELRALADGRNAGLLTALFDLPRAPSLSEVLANTARRALLLGILDVDEPGNVGALIRTALASGAAAAICVGSSDPFHPKAVRTSLGSLFKLPIVRMPSDGLLELLRGHGVFSVAAVAQSGASLDRGSWPASSNVAVLVGNEARGLADSVRRGADERVSIDLSAAADSFCVNAAAAVCLYEVQRRARLLSLTSPGDLTRQEP